MLLAKGPLQISQVLIFTLSVRIWASRLGLIKPMLTLLREKLAIGLGRVLLSNVLGR
jgi:hypothetical protein